MGKNKHNARALKYWSKSNVKVHGDNDTSSYYNYFLEIDSLINFSVNDSVLSIGCGEGSVDSYIISKGCSLWGCDFSETLIQRAKEKNACAKYFVHDFHLNFPHKTQFNKVYSFSVIQYASPKKVFSVIKKSLYPCQENGVIGHFDIIDIKRIHNYFFPCPSLAYIKNIVKFIYIKASWKIQPIWVDGSYVHDVDKIIEMLRHDGYRATKHKAKCNYRSHIIIKNKNGTRN